MNSKRPHIDSLNAGRQRRPHDALEELNRTLDNLGARFDRPYATPERPPLRADERQRRERGYETNPYQGDLLARDFSQRTPGARREPPAFAARELARDIENTRRQEESVASISRIASDLKAMREELRHQMTSGLHREFEALRGDIARAYSAVATGGAHGAELGAELERLSDVIQSLAARSDDHGIELLRRELDYVKDAVGALEREETAERRWDSMDRRFDAFEERFTASNRSMAGDPPVDALNARLEQIADAVNNLPESLSLRTLEDKVRTLAGAVDHFSRQQDRASPMSFSLIEERLDEISRAIVASTVSQSQPAQIEQFERIEARISSLARQIDELADDRPTGEVIDRINTLSSRVDEMARRAEFPERAVERLADQIALISGKLDSGVASPDTDEVVRGLEYRFANLSDLLQKQQGDALSHGQTIFRDLESRLDDLAARLEQPHPEAASDNSALMSAIDQRFEEFTRRFGPSDHDASSEAFRGLESRLEEISSRLEESTRQAAGIDPGLIRSLEAQVASLSSHLSQPGGALPEFDDIGPRLEQIEQSIAGSRETILESARVVAEQTIRSIAGSQQESPAVAALADDLKALNTLTRRSDDRNARTFEAIHDTLLKIVERLGSLETRGGDTQQPAFEPTGRTMVNTPSLEPAIDGEPFAMNDAGRDSVRPGKRSAAEAAVAAATAALADASSVKAEAPARRSMLGGLARKLSGKRAATQAPTVAPATLAATSEFAAETSAPSVEIDDMIDPKLANRPLEPGSGAPDLYAIMKRVRDERGQPLRADDSDAAKSDFIAAARRAAQAAAAEAESRKKGFDKVGAASSSGLGRIFKSHRKAALMAAGGVVLALAGMQLGKAFLTDHEAIATSAPADTATQPVQLAAADIDGAADTATAPIEANLAQTGETVRVVEPTDDIDEAADDDLAATGSLPEEIEVAQPTVAPEPVAVQAVPAAAAKPIVAPVEAGPVPLREAAEAGDAKAMFEIGSRYQEGRGTKADMAAAAQWYERSAEAGFAPGQYRIGNLYEKGNGVERDVAKAKTWYQLAAQQGNASAMHNLAVLYAMGADGTTDNESAGRWFIKAAELGVKDSQFNLGILSAKGVGVPQNLEESYKWFALVAKAGDKDAAAKRDEVANALRPEQLQRARAAAELWKPKPVVAEANDVSIPESWTESSGKTASVDMKQAVRNIQLILNKNGYDAGGADGKMGQKTKTAIASFQAANGMQANGEITEELVRELLKKK